MTVRTVNRHNRAGYGWLIVAAVFVYPSLNQVGILSSPPELINNVQRVFEDTGTFNLPTPSAPREPDLPSAPTAPTEPSGDGEYAFMALDPSDKPLRYNPCRTLRYVVRTDTAPGNSDDALAFVSTAIETVAERTGLQFEFGGTSKAILPLATTWSDDTTLWIGWTTSAEYSDWADNPNAVGYGGSSNDGEWLVNGFANLRSDGPFAAGLETEGEAMEVLLHELGHVLNLDHVGARTELMYASTDNLLDAEFGPGDKRGLWEVGSSKGCAK